MVNSERRRYFRINDTIGLRYRVSDGNADRVLTDCDGQVQMTAPHILQGIDRELNTVINTLWREQPVAATAIALLNRKLAVLAAEIDMDDCQYDVDGLVHEEMEVGLSGCGIGFACSEAFQRGQILDLFITLKPSNVHLTLTGTVIDCERREAETRPYWLRLDFVDLNKNTEEQLIQHIVQRQGVQLGNRFSNAV